MGRFVITHEECDNYSRHFEYSDLRTDDDISEFQQKCRFALRKPPFCPLNYGNKFRDRISDADHNARGQSSKWPLRYLLHQRNKPSAAGDFELAKDRVKVLFHHRQTQTGVISDLLVTPPFADKTRNFLFAPSESDEMRQTGACC